MITSDKKIKKVNNSSSFYEGGVCCIMNKFTNQGVKDGMERN